MKKARENKIKKLEKSKSIINNKLYEYEMLISLANIRRLSIKMRNTGKISKKVEKKWEKRMNKSKFERFCKSIDNKKCKWLPARVFSNKHRLRLDSEWFTLFIWECRVCHCNTTSVYDEEISEPLQKAYSEHVLTHKWD